MRISAVLFTVFDLSFVLCAGYGESFTPDQADSFKEERAEHFIIYYQKQVRPSDVATIKAAAEKYYRVITQEFNLIRDQLWIWDKRATIYIASDKQNYERHFNCSAWSDACVNYHEKIIYTYPGQMNFEMILAHELTHIISREYAGRESFSLWLDEGMATYMEDKYAGGHYRQNLARLSRKLAGGEGIDFSELTALTVAQLETKSKEYVNMFYLEAFSLVYFIITEYDRYNFSRFLSYLRQGMSLEDSLAKVYFDFREFGELGKKWERFCQDQ